jgi:hypothetical protein
VKRPGGLARSGRGDPLVGPVREAAVEVRLDRDFTCHDPSVACVPRRYPFSVARTSRFEEEIAMAVVQAENANYAVLMHQQKHGC